MFRDIGGKLCMMMTGGKGDFLFLEISITTYICTVPTQRNSIQRESSYLDKYVPISTVGTEMKFAK